MVNITIDGQKLQVPEGVTILEAARTANINIPTLCYHEDQKIKSVCRICAVEVEGQRLLQAACSYPVAEGMVVRTSTPTVLNARKNNLELLLAHHPQDCLVCGKNGRCELQKLTQDLNMKHVVFQLIILLHVSPVTQINVFYVLVVWRHVMKYKQLVHFQNRIADMKLLWLLHMTRRQ